MQTFNLYWNHICVLHKQEQLLLEKIKNKLTAEKINLTITYFGLGYPEHLSEYLLRKDANLPDLIVSADLEVFEYRPLWSKIKDKLLPLQATKYWQNVHTPAVLRHDSLLPFTGIPLVYYSTDENFDETLNLAEQQLAIGGIDNSAIKTVTKFLLETAGAEKTKEFLQKASIHPMPIVAYQHVRMKQVNPIKTALVPSIYAMRANQQDSFLKIPPNGPLVIPSYICGFEQKEQSRNEQILKIIHELLSNEFTSFYANQGDLLIFSAATNPYPSKYSQIQGPSGEYIATMDCEAFYDLYVKLIPSAHDYRHNQQAFN